VVGPDGLSLFDQLQSTAGRARAVLFAFDLIQLDGQDQRGLPLLERKKQLAKLLARADGGILYNEHLTDSGDVVFAHACRLGAEGIVSKKIDSSYQSGPHPAWVKVKNPVAIALQRQRAERWGQRTGGA
jgi:bifunctional non-homologous end joining protein LigD